MIGSYVFLWGQKQERTPTWFGMFLADGRETESVDAMHYIWNGEWPANRTPRLNSFTLEGKGPYDNIKLKAGGTFSAIADITDPDNDPVQYTWEIMKESTTNATGGDAEVVPESLPGLFPEEAGGTVEFTAPAEEGAYRIFIYGADGNGHVAHANIPFYVEK